MGVAAISCTLVWLKRNAQMPMVCGELVDGTNESRKWSGMPLFHAKPVSLRIDSIMAAMSPRNTIIPTLDMPGPQEGISLRC